MNETRPQTRSPADYADDLQQVQAEFVESHIEFSYFPLIALNKYKRKQGFRVSANIAASKQNLP